MRYCLLNLQERSRNDIFYIILHDSMQHLGDISMIFYTIFSTKLDDVFCYSFKPYSQDILSTSKMTQKFLREKAGHPIEILLFLVG